MRHYVLGLAFDADAENVLLIRKNRPDWQAGKLNGAGGKVEPGETPLQAMIREFQEETGLDTSAAYWTPFGRIEAPQYVVHCFRARTSRIHDGETMTDELVEVTEVDYGLLAREGLLNVVPLVCTALNPEAPFLVLRYEDLAEHSRAELLAAEPLAFVQ